MCIGGFPAYTDGVDMKSALQATLTRWGASVQSSRFPRVGRTCKVTFQTNSQMWDAINQYKDNADNLIQFDGADV